MTTELSPKAKVNLQRNAQLRQKESKFIKLQAGEKRNLQFDAEKIDPPKEEEFNGKKSQRIPYIVRDLDNGGQEKYLVVSKGTSEVIDTYLMEGRNSLKIQRFGLGIDTRYHITSA
jgi:hypothetical protein